MAADFLAVIQKQRPGFTCISLLFRKVGLNELAVVAGGNKADLLAFRLSRHRQTARCGQPAHLGLRHLSQGKEAPRELLLRQPEEKIGLVLGLIHRPEQPVAAGLLIAPNAGVVAGGDALGAEGAGRGDQPLEFNLRVAETARNRRLACEVLLDKGFDDIALKLPLVIHHIVRNTEELGHTAGVVDIVERAAAPGAGQTLRIFLQTTLIPQLHRQPHEGVLIVIGQQRRNGGAVHPTAHRHGDDFRIRSVVRSLHFR